MAVGRRREIQFRRTGTLFEGRLKGYLVQAERHFLQCCRYIELNPVRTGMITDPAEYNWSSYAVHAFGQRVRMWTAYAEYLVLGKTGKVRQEVYRHGQHKVVLNFTPTPFIDKARLAGDPFDGRSLLVVPVKLSRLFLRDLWVSQIVFPLLKHSGLQTIVYVQLS